MCVPCPPHFRKVQISSSPVPRLLAACRGLGHLGHQVSGFKKANCAGGDSWSSFVLIQYYIRINSMHRGLGFLFWRGVFCIVFYGDVYSVCKGLKVRSR